MHPDTIIGAIVIGLIIGALARLVVPGRQPMGILATLLVGLVGTFAGLFIGSALHAGRVLVFVLEVACAAALVVLYSSMATRSRAGAYR
jgi:uncharacterized membrane protein YeaQ/YmgE (transglycosylase-associated protein family)